MLKTKQGKILFLLGLLLVCVVVMAVGSILLLSGGGHGGTDGTGTSDMNGIFNPNDYQATVTDRLSIGNADSETAHGLTHSTTVKAGSMTAATGTLSETFQVLTFEGLGATAEWTMNLGDGGKAEYVMLEIEEIHEANLEAFGYKVYVDGKETFFLTYEQISSSPNHYFIAVKKADLANPSKVTVKIESVSEKAFAISEVYAYTDFFEKLEGQGIDGSMMIYLHSGDSLDLAEGHINDFASTKFDDFDLGLMFKLNYMSYTDTELSNQIASYLKIASDNNLPLQLMPSLSWSAPYEVADGKGGFFTDVKYGQVLYNSLTGEWVDSTPNSYGNTQWCSWGEPTLLAAQQARIVSLWRRVTGYLANSMASGAYTHDVNTLLEHSVVYKGPIPQSKWYTMGDIDGGDFNPAVIAAAKADGVTLDPTDGLSYEEKKWMNEYQAKYVQALADIYNESYGSTPILVQNGKVTYPTTQFTNNIFSHTVQWVDQTPSHGDLRISGWKSGIGSGFYEASEEFALIDDIRFYQYRVAYGKTGYCNFEMSSLNNPETFKATFSKVYEAGVNFITLFNDESKYNTPSMLKDLDKNLGGEAATLPAHYDLSLLWVDYNRDAAMTDLLTEKNGVISHKNVTINTSNGNLLSTTNKDERYVTYRVTDELAWENGIYLDLEAFDTGSSTIKVYAGENENSLTLVGDFVYDRGQSNSFNKYSIQRFDLTEATKGKSEYVIRIVFEGSDINNTKIKSVTVRKAFGDVTGQKNGVTFTKEQVRLMNMWVSSREEAERMIASYVEKNGSENAVSKDLEILNGMGLPTNVTTMVATEISKLLPATFAISGEGPLGELPVKVKLMNKTTTAQVVMESLSDTGATFTVYSIYQFNERSRQINMTFTALKKGNYRLDKTAWNAFALVADENGNLTVDENGELMVKVQAEFEKPVFYTTLSGRVQHMGNGEIRLIVQNTELTDYNRYLSILMGTECEYQRKAEGSDTVTEERPKTGDYVTITFAEDGITPISCVAVYGQKTGVIKSFTAPDSTDPNTTNGLITFEDGTVYELDYQAYATAITLNGGEKVYARAMTTDDMKSAFYKGRTISITYCPEMYGSYQRLLTITD